MIVNLYIILHLLTMSNLAAFLPAARASFQVNEVDTYHPGPTEILVRNEIIALNAIEYKIARYDAIPTKYPSIIGSTFGGVVHSVGSEVTSPRVGERVVVSKRVGFKGDQYSAYQRYVVVDDVMVSKIPPEIDLAVPASLMMNLTCVVGLFTGRLGLERPGLDSTIIKPRKSLKILIYGGSSSFGSLAVQYLFQAGYEVVTTSSPQNVTFVSQLGATVVVDHTLDQNKILDALLTQGPYDVIVDMISTSATIPITAQVLAAQGGGKLYTVQPGSQLLPDNVERLFEPWSESLYEEENRELQRWVVETYIPKGLLQGYIIALPVEKVDGGLSGLDKAFKRIEQGVTGLKLVIDPWE